MAGQKLSRVVIMAGGTGGHVFPGLALAKTLRENGVEVHWLGTAAGIEARLVPQENIPLHIISVAGLRGKGRKALAIAPFKLIKAVYQARKILRKISPSMVVGFGGFVSGPGGVACKMLKIPLVIHEQNAKAGLTNKLLSLCAQLTLQAFPTAFKNAITVGNPVREELETMPPPAERFKSSHPFRLLVIGGSLGAHVFNQLIPAVLKDFPADSRPEIIHQTGTKHLEATQKAYQTQDIEFPNPKIQLKTFIDDMAEAYSWADMVLCRAGALTVSELCAVGVGAIFVPYPYAVDDHQTMNASFMVTNDAAICVQQSELTQEKLANILKTFVMNREKQIAMANAAYALRKSQVSKKIYDLMLSIIK